MTPRVTAWDRPLAAGRTLLSLHGADLVLIAVGLLTIFISFVHGELHGGDVPLYHRYAVAFWSGPNAFRTLPSEYPPLSLAAFSLTLLPAGGDYITVFAAWMAGFFLLGYWLFHRFEGRQAATAYALYLLLGAAGTLLSRFDIVPVLLVVGAIWAARRGRFSIAHLLLALGVLFKLYPIVLVPILVLEQRHQLRAAGGEGGRRWLNRVVRSACPALVLAALAAVVTVLQWSTAASPLTYNANRPIQVESLPATALWLFSFLGYPVYAAQGWSSANLVGPLGSEVGGTFALLGLVGLAWIYKLFAQGRLEIAAAFLAAVAVILSTSKVLSPQFLIWLLPLAALVDGVSRKWLLVSAITTVIYPVLYLEYDLLGLLFPVPYPADFMLAILIRNAALGVATLTVLLRPLRTPLPSLAGVSAIAAVPGRRRVEPRTASPELE